MRSFLKAVIAQLRENHHVALMNGIDKHGDVSLRIYADFNSCLEDERGLWCWLLRYQDILLDVVAASLDIHDGTPVTLYYSDQVEEWEVDAVLGHVDHSDWNDRWMALPDWSSWRQLRGSGQL